MVMMMMMMAMPMKMMAEAMMCLMMNKVMMMKTMEVDINEQKNIIFFICILECVYFLFLSFSTHKV